MNRKHFVARLGPSCAEVLALCLLFQLSACGGGGPASVAPGPANTCTNDCIVEPFKATSNFALLETQAPFPAAYSTGSGPNWNVLSWGQQAGVNWTPFSIANPSANEELFTSATLATAYDPMSVTFQSDPANGTWTSTTLTQTATNYCGSSPQEFDLFIQPNDPTFVRTNPSGILPPKDYPTGSIPTLDRITGLDFQGTVTVLAASQPAMGVDCAVNQSQVIPSLILSSSTGQTIFYQLELGLECYPGTDPNEGCYNGSKGEYFCFTSNPYCIADPITSFGHSLLDPGDSIAMDGINLAPRLKALVSGGSPDGMMDTNPAHWRVTDMYFGQSGWGQADLESQWSGEFSVQLTY